MLRITPFLAALAFLFLMSPPALAQGEGDSSDDEPAEESDEQDTTPVDEAAETATEAAEEDVETATDAAEEAAETATDAAETTTDAAEEAAGTATEAAEAGEAAAATVAGAAAGCPEEPAEEEAEEGEPRPEVHLTAEAGAIWLTGNTKSITASGAVNFSVAHKMNKFGLVAGGAYGRGVVEGGTDEWVVTATRVFGDARYDRFLVPDLNSIYVMAGAFHDPFAGFDLRFQAGAGYAHQLVKTDVHALALEGGFNYTRDEYIDGVVPNSQNFAGGRVFAGYRLTPTASFGFGQSVEALLGGTDNVDDVFDGRLLSNTEITANISKIFGIKLGFLVNWDFRPPEGFAPVDTTASVTLVATLL